jgi:hypothetical protein
MKFYVYEHWRPDENICFYVGKGFGNRAWITRPRNEHHQSVVNKLSRLGMCVEVRMIESGLNEHEAFTLEKIRIVFWRSRGNHLTNQTDGGDGVSGLIFSKESRAKISVAHKGRKLSEEHKIKIRANSHKGVPRPEAVLVKLRGQKRSIESRAKMSAWQKGKIRSEEFKQKISATLKGRPLSNETKIKMKIAQKARQVRERAALH